MRAALARDVSASFVVFLVAMPLCMGIAIASGVPPERGLLTGIIGGIVVGLLSGAPLQVSGPAAGLVVMVYEIVEQQGMGALAAILVVAGLLQCLAGLLRLGRWFRAISPAVVHGMLAGIGVLIVIGQLHVLVDEKPLASGIANLVAMPGVLLGAFTPEGDSNAAALAVGLVTIAGLLAWEGWRPAALRLVPGALIGVVAGTGLTVVLDLDVARVAMPEALDHMVSLPDAGILGLFLKPDILLAAFALAFVASAETLLSAAAVDRMQDRVRTNHDRELLAQGVGNGLCGLLGGLPMTGVIVRSSANVQAGAMTRLSTILHGVLILASVVLLSDVLRLVPMSALASVLVVIGWRLISLRHVRDLFHAHGPMPVAIWTVTIVGVVAVNLLTGVIAGIVLSIVESLPHLRRPALRIRRADRETTTELRLAGIGTFLGLPRLLSEVEAVPSDRHVRIRTRGLSHVDHTFASALREMAQPDKATGPRVTIVDAHRLEAIESAA
jgi:MFS superfamily sulfate permease-like transporter